MKKLILILLFIPFLSYGQELPEQYWQKGNLHTHSFWSDGDDFPEMIIKWYKDNDYQFIALSDHNTIASEQYWYKLKPLDEQYKTLEKYQKNFGAWVETKIDTSGTYVRLKTFEEYKSKLEDTNSFLIIRSEEVTSSFENKPIHINVTNIKEKIKPFNGHSVYEVMQKTLDAVHAQRKKFNVPMFAHINHPNFGYGINTEDLKKLSGERFFEVYNGHPSVNNNGDDMHIDLESMWDLINISYYNEGKPLLLGIATDDSHNYHIQSSNYSNTGRGWVMVNSQEIETASLIDAMEAGNFYSSSGVLLKNVYRSKEKFFVEVDPKDGVEYEIIFMGYRKGSYSVEELKRVKGTSSYYTFNENDLFVRAKINSSDLIENPYKIGETKQAWVQPLILR
ncbi:MAG: histidinol-phosphatase [Bacteroidetes bacterium]|nr:histidinol-phosphatase [Bacteroidota bacterium]MDA1019103.1 histidinol-phosphatase [Bacteroidota bacterium]